MNSKEKTNKRLKVFYDGGCVLCNAEINIYKNHKKSDLIEFIDINKSSFEAKQYGLDKKDVHRNFHVITKDGKIVTKVKAFREIWSTLGIFKPLQIISGNSLGLGVMGIGYNAFTKVRPYLPRRKDCDDGSCDI